MLNVTTIFYKLVCTYPLTDTMSCFVIESYNVAVIDLSLFDLEALGWWPFAMVIKLLAGELCKNMDIIITRTSLV